MLALTIWQPMAWAIAEKIKPVENRDWTTPRVLGKRIAIHAGKRWHQEHADQMHELLGIEIPPHGYGYMVFGAVLATAVVSRFIKKGDPDPIAESPFFSGRFGWVLDDVAKLEAPVFCRGAQGLWPAPAHPSLMEYR